MGRPLELPPRYAILDAEAKQLRERAAEMDVERRTIRKAAVEAAGWKYCCRCWPRCVGADGFCSCCCFNHVTGKRLDEQDPDFEDTPLAPAPAPAAGREGEG